MNNDTKDGKELSFFSRMSTKITLLVSAIVLLEVIILVFGAAKSATRAMNSTYMNYAKNLAEEAAIGVDFATEFGEKAYGGYAMNLAKEAAVSINFSRSFGEGIYLNYAQNIAEEAVIGLNLAAMMNGALDAERLTRILSSINIREVSSSYCYLVSPTGIMIWHPSTDKIGNKVENAAVTGIVEALAAGQTVSNGSIFYEYKDSQKLAGYAFTAEGNILVVTADYEEFMKIDYDTLLGNIEITGVEDSYAYMVSPDGTMLWHPSADKIGQPVENAAVKGIVSDLVAGKSVQDSYVVYEYKGALKMAGYAFTDTGNIVLVTADYDKLIDIDYNKLIGEIEMTGVDGSYAYMVDSTGTMVFHTNAEKIGQPVENAAVKGIVADLAAGKKVENGSTTYDYQGTQKVAGYAFTSSGNIVIVTADEKVMLAPVDDMRNRLISYGILAVIISIIVVVIITTYMMKGLGQLVPVINATADFDFTHSQAGAVLKARNDEVGVINSK